MTPSLLGSCRVAAATFPLASFGGVDLADLEAVVVRFDRSTRGIIEVVDLAFSAGA
jgi:hypothetical protein